MLPSQQGSLRVVPILFEETKSNLKASYNNHTHGRYILSYTTSKLDYKGVGILSGKIEWNSVQTQRRKILTESVEIGCVKNKGLNTIEAAFVYDLIG